MSSRPHHPASAGLWVLHGDATIPPAGISRRTDPPWTLTGTGRTNPLRDRSFPYFHSYDRVFNSWEPVHGKQHCVFFRGASRTHVLQIARWSILSYGCDTIPRCFSGCLIGMAIALGPGVERSKQLAGEDATPDGPRPAAG